MEVSFENSHANVDKQLMISCDAHLHLHEAYANFLHFSANARTSNLT